MKTSKLEFAGLETANCSEEVSGRHQSCLAFLQKRLGLGGRTASVSPGLLPFTSPLDSPLVPPALLFYSFLSPTPYPTHLSEMGCSLQVRLDEDPRALIPTTPPPTSRAPGSEEGHPRWLAGERRHCDLGHRDPATECSRSQGGEAGLPREVGCSALAFTPE